MSSRIALINVIATGDATSAQQSRAIAKGTRHRRILNPFRRSFAAHRRGTRRPVWPAGPLRRSSVVKILIVTGAIVMGATLATAGVAAAADFPHAQPVYQTPSVGKMPIGKSPIGKSPIGKTPVAARY